MQQVVIREGDVSKVEFFESTDSDDEIVIFNFKSFSLDYMNEPKFHNG
jgi:hypothetical protein